MAEDSKVDIMEATYRVLAAHGFAGLTTQRVADEAGYSQALVHYHYGTKEALVDAFLDHVAENETDWLADLRVGDPTVRLHRFVDMQLSIPHDEEHGRFNVAFLELQVAAARNERYRKGLRSFANLVQETVADIIRDGIEAGDFRPIDPDTTARFLRYALHGAVGAHLTLKEDGAIEDAHVAATAYVDWLLVPEA